MTDSANNTSGKSGKHEFTMNYSERELSCWVEKNGNKLHLHIDNNTDADLEMQPDGSLKQMSGPELAPSNIDFIRRKILENEAGPSGKGSGF